MTGPAAQHERRHIAREFYASALYVALVLLGALVAVPTTSLPPDAELAWMLLGTALGLTIAHYLAFRLASHLTSPGGVAPLQAAAEAGAGVAGGLAVALIAAAPFVLGSGSDALTASLVLLALLPPLAGMMIGRLRGASTVHSIAAGLVVLVLALTVVWIKGWAGH